MLRLVLLVLYLAAPFIGGGLDPDGQKVLPIGGGWDPNGSAAGGDLRGNLDPDGLTTTPTSMTDSGGGLDPNG
jgi:hypothetical protein